jgi:hypothetical protein
MEIDAAGLLLHESRPLLKELFVLTAAQSCRANFSRCGGNDFSRLTALPVEALLIFRPARRDSGVVNARGGQGRNVLRSSALHR